MLCAPLGGVVNEMTPEAAAVIELAEQVVAGEMRRIHFADFVWLGCVAGLLVVDKVLVDRGHRSLSASCRAHPWLTGIGLGVFAAHLLDRLGRWDPFYVLGRLFKVGET